MDLFSKDTLIRDGGSFVICPRIAIGACTNCWTAAEGNPDIPAGTKLARSIITYDDGSVEVKWANFETGVRIPYTPNVESCGEGDITAPTATFNIPFDTIVAIDTIPTFSFDEQMVLKGGSILIYKGNAIHKAIDVSTNEVELSNGGTTFKILNPEFERGESYRIAIPSDTLCDSSGNSYDGATGNQIQFSISIASQNAPTLNAIYPSNGLTEIDSSISPSMTLTEPMLFGTGAVKILTWPGLVPVKSYTDETEVNFQGERNLLTFLNAGLQDDEQYTWEIDADALKATNGLFLTAVVAGSIVFSTADTLAPSLGVQNPANGATVALVDPVLTYDEPIELLGAGEIRLRDTDSNNVIKIYSAGSAEITISVDELSITLTNHGMIAGGNYSIETDANSIADKAGNYAASIAQGAYTFSIQP